MTTDPTTRDRAEWATVALEAFAAVTHSSGEHLATKVADLLTALHHLCDLNNVSFTQCRSEAEAHYDADLDEARYERELEAGAAFARRAELAQVAKQYADLFNLTDLEEDIERLIADACIDPYWDDRTNLLSLLADDPGDLGLVLSTDPECYAVVRLDGLWVVDTSPVDWEALEDRAFPAVDDDSTDQ